MTNPTPIQWVVFDAVGTLIFADPPVHMAYHRIGRKHGSSITPPEASRRFRKAISTRPGDLATSPESERQFWRSLVGEILTDVADPDSCFEDLWRHFAAPGSWAVFADVEETFEALKSRGLKIAIASNFDERLHPVCDGHPLLQDIKIRFISSELGWKKPSPRFFAVVADKLQSPPASILMIGDDQANDVIPARDAGFQAHLIDRSASPVKNALKTLTDLPARLTSDLSSLTPSSPLAASTQAPQRPASARTGEA